MQRSGRQNTHRHCAGRVRRLIAVSLHRFAGKPELSRRDTDQRKDRFEQGDVDDLALAIVDLNVSDGGQQPDRRIQPGDHVGSRQWRQTWRRVGEAVDVGVARHRLHQCAETRFLSVRPGLAPAGDPQDHQPRIDLEQVSRAEPHPLQRARHEVLDHGVSRLHELFQYLQIGFILEVEGNAALVA